MGTTLCPERGLSYLKSDNDGVEIQNWLPVLPQDVEANLALEIDIGMIDLFATQNLRWFVGEALVDGEIEREAPGAIHALVRVNGQDKVEDVIGVGELGRHGLAEGEL